MDEGGSKGLRGGYSGPRLIIRPAAIVDAGDGRLRVVGSGLDCSHLPTLFTLAVCSISWVAWSWVSEDDEVFWVKGMRGREVALSQLWESGPATPSPGQLASAPTQSW